MPMCFYESKIGRIGIAEKDGSISNVYISGDKLPEDAQLGETHLLKEAVRQLESYFAGELKEFTLPLKPEGTEFMKKVWSALCEIPYGKTVSYKEIAEKVGVPKGARAVGIANNRNPIPIFIPCHRVIGADGSLTGYGGGLDMKKYLLELEGLE
ncbi:MAG TPA: methylated-DNA--[protein]-cysteine S-methyltransferase [Bacillota bacterium]|nr:methylated-DNA--[protein]-cysteine S-methyltransferase [Bacillota bacterium]HOR85116.1 methylated-DNA--[protein]-cysteine S-methyltransferase [Bacillota bacterium]